MNDDFNTPEALAVLFELARVVNRAREAGERQAAGLGALLRELGADLGLLRDDPEAFLKGSPAGGPDDAEVERLIAERAEARRRSGVCPCRCHPRPAAVPGGGHRGQPGRYYLAAGPLGRGLNAPASRAAGCGRVSPDCPGSG
ncbi:MAG: DALR domain-containing protein [Arhodomonas sp.]|nr:DALR domain-containing protein [Arhodomonas sp.]